MPTARTSEDGKDAPRRSGKKPTAKKKLFDDSLLTKLEKARGKQRASTLQLRLTDTEKASIEKMAKRFGLKPSAYIRFLNEQAIEALERNKG